MPRRTLRETHQKVTLPVEHPAEVAGPDRLLTRGEAARYLGLCEQTLAQWVTARRYNLRYVKLGRAVRYSKADLDRFVSEHTIGAPSAASAS
jgi:excisionase family DNA binding protein